jgi:two-component system sensor histidine kinase RegB
VNPPALADATNRKNLALLIQLRWIALTGQIATILAATFGLGISLPLERMAWVLSALLLLNLVSYGWWRRQAQVSTRALLVALLLDVGALTAQLYLSGGIHNPFVWLYLLQITLAALVLNAALGWLVAGAVCACFVGLARFHVPLELPQTPFLGGLSLYAIGSFVCLALDAALLVMVVTRAARNLRERDVRLAELRRQAEEEDHIVRVGLLASGAAHELGTPLASVSVILGDWRHLPQIAGDPQMRQEMDQMQAALARCKGILSGILRSAGEARGEAPAITTLHRFFDDLVREWTAERPGNPLEFHAGSGALGEDVNIVSDVTLKQTVTNLLDNAYEVSPKWLRLYAERRGDLLRVEVQDLGPGFPPEMLQNLGKPYQSTRSRPGAGLGLFLVVNVIRKLGGTVSARNRPEGGATVTVELPLSALRYEDR